MSDLRSFFVISFFFFSLASFSQEIVNKDFYLIEGIDLENLPDQDQRLLDSCLSLFHKSDYDTSKVQILGFVCENLISNCWKEYQLLQMKIIKNSIEERKLLKKEINIFHLPLALAYNNLGVKSFDEGKLDEALSYHKKGLDIRKSLNDQMGLAESYINLATVYRVKGGMSKSIYYDFLGLKIYRELNDKKNIASSLNRIGRNKLTFGDHPTARKCFRVSLTIFEELKDQDGIAESLNDFGRLYKSQKELKKANDCYLQALSIAKTRGDEKVCAQLFNNIAAIRVMQGKLEESLDYLLQSLELFKKLDIIVEIPTLLNNIGITYHGLGNDEKALAYFHESRMISEESGFTGRLAYNYVSISRLLYQQQKYEESKVYAKRGFELARKKGSPVDIANAAEILSKLYEVENDFERTFEMHLLYDQMRDSVNGRKVTKQLAEQERLFLIEKKNKEIALLEKDKKLKSVQLKFSILLYLLISSFGIGVAAIFFKRRKQRYQTELNQLRELLAENSQKEMDKKITSIPVTYSKKIISVDPGDVLFFSTVNRIVLLNHKNGRSYAVDFKMSTLEKCLPEQFMRVHRSYIINTKEVQEITKTYKKKVIFRLTGQPDKEIPSSTRYSDQVKSLIENFATK